MRETLVKTEELKDSPLGIIPKDWKVQPLLSVSYKIQDGTHFSPQSKEGTFRYITSKNIRAGYLDLKECGWISKEEHDQIYSRCNVQYGDILLTKDGVNTGNAVINTLREPFSLLSSVAFIRPNQNELNARFLLQYILSPIGQRRLTDMISGLAITRLTLQKIQAFQVPIPPLSEQEGIAEILETMDEAIAHTSSLIAKLKQMKAGLLHDLLTRGLDENGELRDAIAHPEQFKDSPLGQVPKEWEVTMLGAVVARSGGFIQTGPFGSQLHAYEYVDAGVPVIMPQDIQDAYISDSQIAHITPAKAGTLARHRVELNDVVFARRGDLERCAFIGKRELGWLCGTGCLLVRVPGKEIDGRWLAATYRHDRSQRQILARAVGSTMVNLNSTLLSDLLIAKPPYLEQTAIVRVVDTYDSRIRIEEAYCEKLKLQKQGLMHDLLTGKVRVKDA